ncbi:MAG: DUF4199 domain-containing protein [Bacteroidota bacterium]|nr:DUF4199 domain-containing protein [Bacteroidota bacterium]
MEKIKNTVERIGIKYGLLTFVALVAYFLLMQAVGLGHIIELRFLNFIILAYGIYYAIMKLKSEASEDEFYFKGLAEGVVTSMVGVIPFAAFVGFYLAYIDPNLMNEIRQNVPISGYINTFSAFVVVNLEGFASGVLITYVVMQYFSSVEHKETKRPYVKEKSHIET